MMMLHGINKFGEKATTHHVGDEIDMRGNRIVGLPTRIGDLTGEGDAVSHRILLDVMDRFHDTLLRTNGSNRMTGDLLMDSTNNDTVVMGCSDFGSANKSFAVMLGNTRNALIYNTLVRSQPVTLYTWDGFLVKIKNVDIIKFSANVINLFTHINANKRFIYNLPTPSQSNDACTKGYADGVVKKCHVGLIPPLSRNTDKSGYIANASSQQGIAYAAFKAFRFGNTEWVTDGITSNFWIKIKCLEAMRVWKFVLTGRRNDSPEQIHNWRFEGSSDDSDWTVLHSETAYTVDSSAHQFNVENNTNSYQYYRIFAVEGHGPNPGLSHIQLFVYCN